jgi:polyadenylate-binding protein
MEESKLTPVIFAVSKESSINSTDIKNYIGDEAIHVETITSPKGYKIYLPTERANKLLAMGEDTLKTERVNFAEDDPFCTLFVKGITKAIDDTDLSAALSTEGKICMVSIMKNIKMEPVGSAFVRFNRKEDALKAAEKYATLTVNDVPLECSKYEPKHSKPKSSTATESASFKNMPSNMSQDDAAKFLGEYGQIAELQLDEESRAGVVSYVTLGAVTKAIQALNGHKFEDRAFLITDNTEKRKSKQLYNNLYIGNVDQSATDEEIKTLFSKYGEIESLLRPTRAKVLDSGETIQIPKNHLFLAFKDSKAASSVIQEIDGQLHWGKSLDVNYYDSEAKHGPKAKSGNNKAQMEEMTQNFMQMLGMMATTISSNNMGNRGRGGYGGPNPGYRGTNTYNRGGRGGTRGVQRGGRGGRGQYRGGPPGGQYQVRSEYEKPMMPSHMQAPPPMGPSVGGYQGQNMGFSGPPPMGPSSAYTMPQPMMQQPVPQKTEPASAPQPTNALGLSIDELSSMSKEEQENVLGTFLYNKLEPLRGGDVAGKITGMFLDLPLNEIYEIATLDEVFTKYLKDAIELIENEDNEL